MTIDTKKLRQAATSAKEFASVGAVTHPHTAKAHINGLADVITTCCGEIDAQSAEIAALRTNAEYGIKEREFLHAEAERLKKALRVAVLALAHATQEHGKVYEPAYNAVDAALSEQNNEV